MSQKRKKKRRKARKTVPARQAALSPQQGLRMQQALQAQSAGNLAMAESIYRGLISENVRIPQLFSNLGLIYSQKGDHVTSRKLFRKALALDPQFTDARMHLAAAQEQAGEIEASMDSYEKVLQQNPAMHISRYLLANQLKNQGRIEEAIAHYRKIMSQQPGYTQAHFSYAGVHKYRDKDDPHLASMLELYRNGALGPDGRIQLAFALAKAYEDLADFSQAFQYLKAGNDLRAAKYRYTIDSDRELIDNIIATFSAEAMSSLGIAGQSSRRPILIIGMPRSGTTLVEKILASHSDVVAGGELDYLFALGAEKFLDASIHYQFRPLDSYSSELYESVGKIYLEKTDWLGPAAPGITDKQPFNFLMLGLLRIALPNARIVHCVRDPRDTCLSIYKQNFTTDNYRFAYDLEAVGQYHVEYRKLMKHWHRVMPGHIYDVEYESLTRNPEDEIRRLLAACGLEWQDACLDFHKSKGLVTTASFFQVRQPMYTSSVQLWEKYREFLGPLFKGLGLKDVQKGTD